MNALKSLHMAFRRTARAKGYDTHELAARCGLTEAKLNDRVCGRTQWRWGEVLTVCRTLDMELAEFRWYFPG